MAGAPRERIALCIEGLCCAEEIGALRREVGSRPGITALEFDLLSAKMTAEFDPDVTDPDQIATAVRATGMRARPWCGASHGEETLWRRHGRQMMTWASGLCTAGGFTLHATLHESPLAALRSHVAADLPLAGVLLYCTAIVTGVWFVGDELKYEEFEDYLLIHADHSNGETNETR